MTIDQASLVAALLRLWCLRALFILIPSLFAFPFFDEEWDWSLMTLDLAASVGLQALALALVWWKASSIARLALSPLRSAPLNVMLSLRELTQLCVIFVGLWLAVIGLSGFMWQLARLMWTSVAMSQPVQHMILLVEPLISMFLGFCVIRASSGMTRVILGPADAERTASGGAPDHPQP